MADKIIIRSPKLKAAPARKGQGERVIGFASGMRAMAAPDFLHSVKHNDQLQRANRVGAHEKILLFEKKFLSKTKKLGIPIFAHCIVRDRDEQERVFREGFSKARYGESAHNFGLAIDLIHGVVAWDLPKESWQMLGHIGREIAVQNGIHIVWGGDDPHEEDTFNWDPAHWELKDWRRIKETY